MFLFLKDVLLLSVSAFGGPQAHIGMLFQKMVQERRYVTEEELLELNALCQILPGPTSTQTVVALGFKLGGVRWAYFTLLVWSFPAVLLMLLGALLINFYPKSQLGFTKFLTPVAIGCMAFAGYNIINKVITSVKGICLMVLSAIIAFIFKSPWLFPFMLIAGGIVTGMSYEHLPKVEEKKPLKIRWGNFILWIVIYMVAAFLSSFTDYLPVKIFQSFYRNGSLIFGGGQVLIPMLYTEFVQFKEYLNPQEFNIGYAMVHLVPGPVFSISAYLGALSAQKLGIFQQIFCGLSASVGIFLPGTFLMFFLIRFWEQLKQYRAVKASLEGLNAINAGLLISAILGMITETPQNWLTILLSIGSFGMLQFAKIPMPYIIIGTLILGFIF